MLLKAFILFQFAAGAAAPDSAAVPDSSGAKPADRHCIISSITLEGNKVTRPHIIMRELTFKVNDTLKCDNLAKEVKQSRRNLLNAALFNFVTFDTVRTTPGRIDVKITLVERWYTWPVPLFEIAERNFNTWWLTRDLSRTNYGFYLIRENFRGRKESVALKFRFGYSQQFGISYNMPYLSKKQTHGLGMSVSYSRSHEVAYNTLNNKLQFLKDLNKYLRSDLASRITYTYRQGYYNTHLAEVRLNKGTIADTVRSLTSRYFINDRTEMEYFGLTYEFRMDHRDSRPYPLTGYYFDIEATKMGLGLLENEKLDVFYIESNIRKYWKVYDRVFLATGLKAKISSTGNQPYAVQRALGYRDYVRAYEYYVIDGQSYGLAKAQLRYQLVKPRTKEIPYLRMEKFNKFHYAFYLGVFSDAGFVEDRLNYKYNQLTNTLLLGSGVGLDFVTYYDTTLRLEYSFNRQRENGIFIHFASPI